MRKTTLRIASAILITAWGAAGCQFLERADDVEEPVPLGGAAAASAEELSASILAVDVRALDLEMALTLVAMPLSCLDRPHAAPRDRSGYLDEFVAARRPGYERSRSFYGCWDWHSAVNSTWAMIMLLKEFPDIPVAGLVREKLDDHLSQGALEGELAFFEENTTFERPYGWAWLLKLYAELETWEHPDAPRWASNVEPLARLFSSRMVSHLSRLERPSRSGAHSNTAFALAMMLDAARTTGDTSLEEAVVEASNRLFAGDFGCPTAYEPWGSDFLSPCLEEAALMASVLDPTEFVVWFDDFMPAVHSREFSPLTAPIDTSEPEPTEEPEGLAALTDQLEGDPEEDPSTPATTTPEESAAPEGESADTGTDENDEADANLAIDEQRQADEALRSLASRSHLIGLAFIRADAMNRIAAALPTGDPRVEVYRKLAALHGSLGFEAMFDASYAGSHWIGTFALKYLLSERRPPLPRTG